MCLCVCVCVLVCVLSVVSDSLLPMLLFATEASRLLCSWNFPGKNTGVACHKYRRQETGVQSLSQKDPLKKETASYSSILAWRIPGSGEPAGLPSMGGY